MVTTEAEISFSEGIPIPPDVRPVIIVSGTDYEMGYQWFQQYSRIFGTWILEEMQKKLTEEQIQYLECYQGNINEYTPEFTDMIRGMSGAANDLGVPLSYAEVMAEYCLPMKFTSSRNRSNTAGLPGDSGDADCSGFAAWGSATKDGKLVCLGIGDSRCNKYEHTVIVMPKDKDSNSFILSPYYKQKDKVQPAWIPLHPGMNNKGLAYPHHGTGVEGNEPPQYETYGIPLPFSTMHTLRYAGNAAEALAKQMAYPGYQKGLWADTGGDAFVLECRDPQTVRRPGDHGEKDFIYGTSGILTEELGKFLPGGFGHEPEYIPHGGWLSPINTTRNLQFWNMLHNYHGQVDFEFARMVSRFAGKPPDDPEEDMDSYMASRGKGWDTTVGNQANEMVGVMLPDNGNEGLYYVCSPRSARKAYPFNPTEQFYPPGATYSFYQLKLASEPAEVVEAAKVRAKFDLYHANSELRKLTCRDVPYAPLDAIFNRAATECAKGEFLQNLFQGTGGNERMALYGKSLRAFTRCQAYANQVYEALVPPPETPADLGLREWLGAWGKWATINY